MREIKTYFRGEDSIDGAGVRLKRCFGFTETPNFDPFLLLDFFDSKDPNDYIKGFPWHPHRGIETITYLIEGEIDHEDSLGNKGTIAAGECQWMRAGSGILHQEMPQAAEYMLGSQLWLNMSAEEKMIDPNYKEININNVERVEEKDKIINIIAGEYEGVKGPIERKGTEPTYLDIQLDKNTEFNYEVKDGFNFFALVIEGRVNFEAKKERFIDKASGVLYERKGEKIIFNTGDEGARVLLIGGKPLNEGIAWRGPIVMNTNEEIETAFNELREDKFIKVKNLKI